jgi:hypothetical protein
MMDRETGDKGILILVSGEMLILKNRSEPTDVVL